MEYANFTIVIFYLSCLVYWGLCDDKCGCCPKPCQCTCVPTALQETKDTLYPKCDAELDVCLIVDSSGSIGEAGWKLVLKFMKDIANSFVTIGSGGARVAPVTFSTNATVQWHLTSSQTASRNVLLKAIDDIQQDFKFTNVVDALDKATFEVFSSAYDNPAASNVAVFMTDGRTGFKIQDLSRAAQDLRRVARVAAVGVSNEVEIQQLELIATGLGSKNVFTVFEFSDLHTLVGKVIEAICPPDSLVQKPKAEDNCFCCCPPPPNIHGYHGFDIKQGHYRRY